MTQKYYAPFSGKITITSVADGLYNVVLQGDGQSANFSGLSIVNVFTTQFVNIGEKIGEGPETNVSNTSSSEIALASANGVVAHIEPHSTGWMLVMKYDDGTTAYYTGLSEVYVATGQRVLLGDYLGFKQSIRYIWNQYDAPQDASMWISGNFRADGSGYFGGRVRGVAAIEDDEFVTKGQVAGALVPTLQSVTDVGYVTSNSIVVQDAAFESDLANESLSIGYVTGATGTGSVYYGHYAGNGSSGTNKVLLGAYAGYGNSGNHLVAAGYSAGINNSGSNVIALGTASGVGNVHSNVILFGQNSTATGNDQIVFRTNIYNARHSISGLTDDRLYTWPNASGTVALLSDITGGFVPLTRTLTINGNTQDLSSDRTWTIPTEHFANTDLTATGDRTHEWAGYKYGHYNMSWFDVITETVSNYNSQIFADYTIIDLVSGRSIGATVMGRIQISSTSIIQSVTDTITPASSYFAQYTNSFNWLINSSNAATLNTTGLSVIGTGTFSNIANGTGDFVTATAGGLLKRRTAIQTLSDIGAVSLTGSYANPTWITSLAWGKITGTPTTLSGYGITDAVSSSAISGTANQVAYFTGTNIIGGNAAFTWSGSILAITGHIAIGSGTVVSPWFSGYSVIAGERSSIAMETGDMQISYNAYFDTSWKHKASTVAPLNYSLGTSAHLFRVAPTGGTAGAAITWTNVFSINISGTSTIGTGTYSGNVGVGVAADASYRLLVTNTTGLGIKIATTGSSSNNPSLVLNDATNSVSMIVTPRGSSSDAVFGTFSNHPLTFMQNNTSIGSWGTTGMSIASSGTTVPLSIAGNNATSYTRTTNLGGAYVDFGHIDATRGGIRYSGNDVMYFNATGFNMFGSVTMSSTLTVAGIFNSSSFLNTGTGTWRIQNTGSTVPAGSTGVGLEGFISSNISFLDSYNRSTSAYAPLTIRASTITFNYAITSTVAVMSSTGIVVTGMGTYNLGNSSTTNFFGINGTIVSGNPLFKVVSTADGQIARYEVASAGASMVITYATGTTDRGYIGFGANILTGAAVTEFVLRSEGAIKLATGGNNLRLTISSAGNITTSGYITSPGTGGAGSERFGLGSDASSNDATSVGNSSSASTGGTAVGRTAIAHPSYNTAIGSQAIAGAVGGGILRAVAVGAFASSIGYFSTTAGAYSSNSSSYGTIVGSSSTASGANGSMVFGAEATSTHSYAFAVGRGATTTAANQMMMGTATNYMDIYSYGKYTFLGSAFTLGGNTNSNTLVLASASGTVGVISWDSTNVYWSALTQHQWRIANTGNYMNLSATTFNVNVSSATFTQGTNSLSLSTTTFVADYSGGHYWQMGGLNVMETSSTTISFRDRISKFYGSVNAASAIARGIWANNTLVATANSDVLVGVDINPSFTNGAFTGVTNLALRVQGDASFQTGGTERVLINASGMSTGYDIEITDATKGLILKSPGGTRYRVVVDNLGGLVISAV
jgi:hypothetical protein